MNDSPINLGVIYDTLGLDDTDLLDKVTLLLHQHFGSVCTCVVEFNCINTRVKTIAYACQNQLQAPSEHPLVDTPWASIQDSDQDYIFHAQGVSNSFANYSFLADRNVDAYIGIPLRTASGEVLGILQSSFDQPILETTELIYFHKLFARLIVHSLREKWLADKSNMLVNQLSFEVSHDNLTGLLNRNCLSSKLAELTERKNQSFSLASIDIDNFKSVNDLYGNHIGDEVIKFVANAIRDAIPDHQLAFRIAGDEFAFIALSEDPFEICNQIINKIEEGYQDTSHNIKVKISIGLASNSAHYLTVDQLMLNASLALKECKRSPHHHVQCYDTHLSVQYYRRAMVIDALRSELDKDVSQSDVYVVVQPIVAEHSNRWEHFEILARWQSETLGNVSPLEFIHAAEQSGLIIELGERILELACRAKQKLEYKLGYKITLSINCSACEIQNSNHYLHYLIDTIQKYGFGPDEFTIELTETVLLSKTDEVRRTLDNLRLLGFAIALDDFGTGYSSLNYIHSYPIDYIKVDATFIRNMLSSQTAERVVWLIIQLAKQLHVKLIAEGVESKLALDKLHAMGCEYIQGYYYARPHTPDELLKLYKASQESESRVSNG